MYWIFAIPQIAQKLSQKSSNDQKFQKNSEKTLTMTALINFDLSW